MVDSTLIAELIDILFHSDKDRFFPLLDTLREQHIQARNFFDQILYALRDRMISSFETTDFSRYKELFLVFRNAYGSIRLILNEWLLIELTLIEALHKPTPAIATQSTSTPSVPTSAPPAPTPAKKSIEPIKTPKTTPETPIQTPPTPPSGTETASATDFSYRVLLDGLKTEGVIVVALKNASFTVDNTTLTLRLSSKWHYDKLCDTKYMNTLKEKLSVLFGGEWQVLTELVPSDSSGLIDDVFV